MSNFRRRLISSIKKDEKEYTELEYLQSTGTQIINANIGSYDSNNKYDIYCEMSNNVNSTTTAQINGWDGGGGFGYKNGLYYSVGSVTSSQQSELGKFDMFHNIINKNLSSNSELYLNGEFLISRTHSSLNTYGNGDYYIFASNSKGLTVWNAQVRIKSYKILINDVLVRDFIPVKRNFDGELGLLDKLNNVFYANVGTGEFGTGLETEYVQSGLVLHYDGILNTKNGNNPSANAWEDLSGIGNDGYFINTNNTITYKENGYEILENSDYVQSKKNLEYLTGNKNFTVEIVSKSYGFGSGSSTIGQIWFGSTSATAGTAVSFFGTESYFGASFINVGKRLTKDVKNNIVNLALRKKIGNVTSDSVDFLVNNDNSDGTFYGTASTTNIINSQVQVGRAWQWGGSDRTLNGIVYAFRIYNRLLTDEELKQNYEIDKKRYHF